MKCSLCGYRYTEEEGKPSCHGCPLKGGCDMLRCPVCGYEIPKAVNLQNKNKRSWWNKNANQ
jgi:rubredoxin